MSAGNRDAHRMPGKMRPEKPVHASKWACVCMACDHQIHILKPMRG